MSATAWTYSNLLTRILKALNRVGDNDALAEAPSWIELAEADMRRRLGIVQQVREVTVSADGEYVVLDATTSWQLFSVTSLRFITGSTEDRPLEFLTMPEFLRRKAEHLTVGRPKFATIVSEFASPGLDVGGGIVAGVMARIRVAPAADQDYTGELVLQERPFPVNSVGLTRNEALSEAPDAYLYGACMHAALYYEDAAMAEAYRANFETAIQQLKVAYDDRHLSTGARARIPVAF